MLNIHAATDLLPLPVDEIIKDYRSSDAARSLAPEPNAESIFDAVYEMMREVDPVAYPKIY